MSALSLRDQVVMAMAECRAARTQEAFDVALAKVNALWAQGAPSS